MGRPAAEPEPCLHALLLLTRPTGGLTDRLQMSFVLPHPHLSPPASDWLLTAGHRSTCLQLSTSFIKMYHTHIPTAITMLQCNSIPRGADASCSQCGGHRLPHTLPIRGPGGQPRERGSFPITPSYQHTTHALGGSDSLLSFAQLSHSSMISAHHSRCEQGVTFLVRF